MNGSTNTPLRTAIVSGSFRDPCGCLIQRHDVLTRLIRPLYQKHYEHLFQSGLYKDLTEAGLLVAHRESPPEREDVETYGELYKLIQPDLIPMISYPYEWCFSQLQAAALTTLEIEKRALAHGMTLKDSPATNIQFLGCRPMLIDTLSFECLQPGTTWKAYRQFCQHFLAPLLLLRKDYRFSELMLYEMDGIPLDMTSKLLSGWSYLSFGVLLHIHLHAKAQKVFETKKASTNHGQGRGLSQVQRLGLIDSLQSLVSGLKYPHLRTEWGDYYQNTNYSASALSAKESLVAEMLERCQPCMVWDLGANNGRFSRLAAERGNYTVAMDIDPEAVEHNFAANRERTDLLPLRMDLRNPSPDNGWGHGERAGLSRRGPADTVMALALIHHLSISNNVPFARLADWLAKIGNNLIIEFVPKDDSMVERLLSSREDVFPNYRQDAFEEEFSRFFTIADRRPVPDSHRTLYLMKRKDRS